MNDSASPFSEFVTRWSRRAEEMDRLRALVDGAQLIADVLADIQQLDRAGLESVTLRDASALGGYSLDHLQRLVASGQIENVGKRYRPRIRRSSVPVKPGHSLPSRTATDDVSDRRRIAAAARDTRIAS